MRIMSPRITADSGSGMIDVDVEPGRVARVSRVVK